ncbi:MAG: hypothetical protein ACLUES_11385 [Flavonifractor plautii]
MERLPDAELEVMQALWRQEKYPVSSAALMEELAEAVADGHPAQAPLPPGGAGLCEAGEGGAE